MSYYVTGTNFGTFTDFKSITTDASYIYFISSYNTNVTIKKYNTDLTNVSTKVINNKDPGSFFGSCVSNQRVFWSSSSYTIYYYSYLDDSSGAITNAAAGGLAVDNTYLYASNYNDASFSKFRLSDLNKEFFFNNRNLGGTNSPYYEQIIHKNGYLFFCDFNTSSGVHRYNISTNTLNVYYINTGTGVSFQRPFIAADDNYLYTLNNGDSSSNPIVKRWRLFDSGTTTTIDSSFVLNTGGLPYYYFISVFNNNIFLHLGNNNVNKYPIPSTGSAPIINSITPILKGLSVSYTGPVGASPAPTTYYYSVNGGSTYTDAISIANPLTISGLTNNQSYSVMLIAKNALGNTAASNAVSQTPYIIGSPPIITTIDQSLNALIVNFTDLSKGNPIPTTYKYSLNSGAYTDANKNSSPIIITGLTNQLYTVRLTAYNSTVGDTSASNPVGQTPYILGGPPSISSIDSSLNALIVNFSPSTGGNITPITYYYSFNGTDVSGTGVSSSPLTITGLTTAQSYTVYVIASTSKGNVSSSSSSGQPFVLGSAPVINSVTPGINSFSVSYNASSNGYPSPTYYYSLNNGASYIVITPTSNPFTITDVSLAITYTIKMKAVNSAGTVYSTNTINAIPIIPGPVPTISSISRVFNSETSLSVSFNDSSGGYPALTKYRYSLDGGSTFSDASGTSSPIIITGLTADTSYNVVMRAVSNADWTSTSPIYQSRTNKFGSPPSNLVVSNVYNSETTLNIAFTGSSGGNPALTKYRYSLDGGLNFSDAIGTSSPITITGLTADTSYNVVMRAVSSTWESLDSTFSNTVRTYKIGTPPSGLTVSNVFNSETTLRVSFGDSSGGNPALTKYRYSLNGGAFLDASSTISPITITGLTADTSYNVVMRAVSNSSWESLDSSFSNTVRTYKIGSDPSGIVVSRILNSETSLKVTFTGSSGGNPPLTKYEYSLNGGLNFLDASGTNSPIIITGLTAGTPYTVVMRARSDLS